MTYELQCDRNSATVNLYGLCQEASGTTKLAKRFTIPKKFRNNHFTTIQANPFMKVYHYNAGAPKQTLGTFPPRPATEVNERTRDISYLPNVVKYTFQNDYLRRAYKFGVSYTRMSMMGEINFYR